MKNQGLSPPDTTTSSASSTNTSKRKITAAGDLIEPSVSVENKMSIDNEAMGRMFKERDMKEELEKLEREDPDNDYARYMMRDRVGTLGLMALDSTRTSQVQRISRRLF